MSATAGEQYKKPRVFGAEEVGSTSAVECANCHVVAVPRGIVSARKGKDATGESHCPNCGHVHGRNSLLNRKVRHITVVGAGGATTITADNGALQLSATILPDYADNKGVTWSITNGTGTATISDAGVVTAVTNGTVTAVATAKDGSGVTGTLVITLSNQV